MEVLVHLFSMLRKGRFENSKVGLPLGADISDLLEHLSIRRDEVGVLIVDKKEASLDRKLEEGNVVTIIPPIGGG